MNDGQEIVLSLDGKTVRGTIPTGERQDTHLLGVYVPAKGLALAQAAVDRKKKEIVVAPQVLEQVSLAGKIVIADEMHTQKAFCHQLVEKGAAYVLTAKDNQARTRWAIEKLFMSEVCNLQKGATLSKDFRKYVEIRKGHGRIEKRTILTSTLMKEYLVDWAGLAQVFRIETVVWHAQASRSTRHIRYGLTSLSPCQAGPKRILELVKEYWGIESGLHYRRDVTFHEDATRMSHLHATCNMTTIHNTILSLFARLGCRNAAQTRRGLGSDLRLAFSLIISEWNPPHKPTCRDYLLVLERVDQHVLETQLELATSMK